MRTTRLSPKFSTLAVSEFRWAGVLIACITLLQLLPAPSLAALFVPAGVTPGSQYQLAFITSQPIDADGIADSWEIYPYNDFVNNLADSAGIGPHSLGGVLWHAIASTATVDAIDNAPVTAPLYTMHGDLIATSSADLWDGTIGHTIDYCELGTGPLQT
jgi:hypothetical protein